MDQDQDQDHFKKYIMNKKSHLSLITRKLEFFNQFLKAYRLLILKNITLLQIKHVQSKFFGHIYSQSIFSCTQNKQEEADKKPNSSKVR